MPDPKKFSRGPKDRRPPQTNAITALLDEDIVNAVLEEYKAADDEAKADKRFWALRFTNAQMLKEQKQLNATITKLLQQTVLMRQVFCLHQEQFCGIPPCRPQYPEGSCPHCDGGQPHGPPSAPVPGGE